VTEALIPGRTYSTATAANFLADLGLRYFQPANVRKAVNSGALTAIAHDPIVGPIIGLWDLVCFRDEQRARIRQRRTERKADSRMMRRHRHETRMALRAESLAAR
jgi:hypothetical protein